MRQFDLLAGGMRRFSHVLKEAQPRPNQHRLSLCLESSLLLLNVVVRLRPRLGFVQFSHGCLDMFRGLCSVPPHSPPACCRSLRAPFSAPRAESTSAGTSCCGALGNRLAVGTRMVAARSRVAIFICSSESGAESNADPAL